MMEEVQLKAKPEDVAPLYKTSKIDNKSKWIYIQSYNNITNKQKDKYNNQQARNSIISQNVYKNNRNYVLAI